MNQSMAAGEPTCQNCGGWLYAGFNHTCPAWTHGWARPIVYSDAALMEKIDRIIELLEGTT